MAPDGAGGGGVKALGGTSDGAALWILDECFQQPPTTELLPLLALSVLATRTPFSAGEVSSLALRMSEQFGADANDDAAERLIAACAASLDHCGAREVAADLRESQAIRRLKARPLG